MFIHYCSDVILALNILNMKTEFMKAVIEDLHVTNCEQKQVDALT